MLQVFFPEANVLVAIGSGELSIAVFQIFLPISFVDRAVLVDGFALAMSFLVRVGFPSVLAHVQVQVTGPHL